MSFDLSIDTYLLCSLFNISSKKLTDEYSGLTIDQIMQAEAQQGNTAAAGFDQTILSDPEKLIELFELNDPGNKYAILSNMNEDDLSNMLPLLGQEDLIQGLNYFTKDKLLDLTQSLPEDQLLNYTFSMFSEQHVMAMMPDEQLNKMLLSTDMDKETELKYVQTIDPAIMAKMIQNVTGQQAAGVQQGGLDGKPKYDVSMLTSQLAGFSDDNFNNALLSMPTAHKQAFVYKLAKDNPNLYTQVDPSAYTDMINAKKDKQDMLRYANHIDTDQLVKMNQTLPKELMSVVLTQIDTSKFAGQLQGKFKNVLSQIMIR